MVVVLGVLLAALPVRFPFEGCVDAGRCLPEGDGSVPDLIGMTVVAARRTLVKNGYGCAIVAEEAGAGPRLVVEQDEEAGSRDPSGRVVRLTVSKPYAEDARYPRDPGDALLGPGCADERGPRGDPH